MSQTKGPFEAIGALLKAFGKAFLDQMVAQMQAEFRQQLGAGPFGSRKAALDRAQRTLGQADFPLPNEDKERLLFEAQRLRTAIDAGPFLAALEQAIARSAWGAQAVPKLAFWQALTGSQKVSISLSGPISAPTAPAAKKAPKRGRRPELAVLQGGKGAPAAAPGEPKKPGAPKKKDPPRE